HCLSKKNTQPSIQIPSSLLPIHPSSPSHPTPPPPPTTPAIPSLSLSFSPASVARTFPPSPRSTRGEPAARTHGGSGHGLGGQHESKLAGETNPCPAPSSGSCRGLPDSLLRPHRPTDVSIMQPSRVADFGALAHSAGFRIEDLANFSTIHFSD
uniref:Uncharacterized protein n=5 Tax=Aegilops tauschii subsp. strangulata TaxID=200361 RepID=A0A453SH67_AEGTS